MQKAVVGITDDVNEAEKVIESLKEAGFTADDISVLMPDRFGAQELGYEKHTKAPEGVSAGVTAGAILGGAFGYLVGIGAVLIPGAGPLLAAGPIVAALSGAAAVGAVGGISGGLIGLGMPEYEARKYERKFKFGSTLIAVHTNTDKEAKAAEEIFNRLEAADVHSIGEDSVRKSKIA